MFDGPVVAIVGSRKPTSYGRQVTYQLAASLARAGCVVVSGLAYGIDSIAHEACLDAGGRTVAVQARGLDDTYPARHRPLAESITSRGAIVSEYPAGTTPRKPYFVARNRIISGLSDAVIVTEANASSGSLITAKFALDQNRTVMAVPGNITSERSAGPNNLIRQGAVPVTSASDVLNELGFEATTNPAVTTAGSPAEQALIDLLNQGISADTDLIIQSRLSARDFAQAISLMEISGKVKNLGAGRWVMR